MKGKDRSEMKLEAVINGALGHDSRNLGKLNQSEKSLARPAFALNFCGEMKHLRVHQLQQQHRNSPIPVYASLSRTHSLAVQTVAPLPPRPVNVSASTATHTPVTYAMATKAVAKATNAAPLVQQYITSQKVGVVVTAGKMSRAVKVRVAGQEWNKMFRKHFPSHKHYTVSAPNNSLVEGDVVRITSGHRTSSTIRHVVTAIVAPFGQPVEDRPRVLNAEELDKLRTQERLLKDVRAAESGRQASVQRLAQAKKQGVRIPTLEEAMEKMRVHQEIEKTRAASKGKEAHAGQGGQRATKRERRKAEKIKSRAERHAAERAENAKKQVA